MSIMNKFLIISVVLLTTLVGCNQIDFDPIDVQEHLGEKVESTISIADLKSQFVNPTVLFNATKMESANPLVINGIVTSTDTEGNVYKYITVQEEIQGGHAIKISVDVSGLSGKYPLGQRVSVVCDGLHIGNFAQSPQIGVYFNNITRNRIEPGRMPKPKSDKHIIAYGMPDPAAIVADTMTLAQIKAAGASVYNKLVCIKDAWFTGRGANFGEPANINNPADRIFAPSTNGIGFPQSREIQDGSGVSMFISTSEYAKFANNRIPASDIKGNITAIVGWYNDRDTSLDAKKIYHQLTLRTLSDLGKGFESYHNSN